jgi:hypothetical protein
MSAEHISHIPSQLQDLFNENGQLKVFRPEYPHGSLEVGFDMEKSRQEIMQVNTAMSLGILPKGQYTFVENEWPVIQVAAQNLVPDTVDIVNNLDVAEDTVRGTRLGLKLALEIATESPENLVAWERITQTHHVFINRQCSQTGVKILVPGPFNEIDSITLQRESTSYRSELAEKFSEAQQHAAFVKGFQIGVATILNYVKREILPRNQIILGLDIDPAQEIDQNKSKEIEDLLQVAEKIVYLRGLLTGHYENPEVIAYDSNQFVMKCANCLVRDLRLQVSQYRQVSESLGDKVWKVDQEYRNHQRGVTPDMIIRVEEFDRLFPIAKDMIDHPFFLLERSAHDLSLHSELIHPELQSDHLENEITLGKLDIMKDRNAFYQDRNWNNYTKTEHNDWSSSSLYKFVEEEHLKFLNKLGLANANAPAEFAEVDWTPFERVESILKAIDENVLLKDIWGELGMNDMFTRRSMIANHVLNDLEYPKFIAEYAQKLEERDFVIRDITFRRQQIWDKMMHKFGWEDIFDVENTIEDLSIFQGVLPFWELQTDRHAHQRNLHIWERTFRLASYYSLFEEGESKYLEILYAHIMAGE